MPASSQGLNGMASWVSSRPNERRYTDPYSHRKLVVLVGITPRRRQVAMFSGLGNWQCSITQRLPRIGISRSISSYMARILSMAAPPAHCTCTRRFARAAFHRMALNVSSDVSWTPFHFVPRAPT